MATQETTSVATAPEPLARTLAGQASVEIAAITRLLDDLIESNDEGGDIGDVSRGMLRRIRELNDAAMMCFEEHLGDGSYLGKLYELIMCSPLPAAEEVADHG
ncbi:MAG: hypothetical protein KGL43_24810 [Burkholderiales bacterium]|nr:hypothetical protein [Burkholderiales bacterium]MDE2395455.1 hypothetical protein [Burkholderiales bacterium]MDE2456823.1 hypothetical protein [Burkholderiales bacterium]